MFNACRNMDKQIMKRFALFLPVLAFFSSNVMAGEVPGTSVSITAPNGYVAAERFPGFMDDSSGSSIMVTEIPGPFKETASGFVDKQRMKAQNMTILSTLPVKVDGHAGILLEAEQNAYGALFRKWIVAVDYSGATTLIVASYPETSAKQGEPLKQAILSARFGHAGDPADALGFTVMPVLPFRVAKVFGQNMILTPGGEIPVKDESVPLMVFGLSLSKDLVIPDRKTFSENRARKTAGIRKIVVVANTPVTIDGLSGYATAANGEGEESAIPLTLYQILLFDDNGYTLMQGITPLQEKNSYLPVFETIARSFRMKARQQQ